MTSRERRWIESPSRARADPREALLERDLAVALATTEGEADARDASIVVARAACAACEGGRARVRRFEREREARESGRGGGVGIKASS